MGHGASPWFAVENLDAVVSALRARGVQVDEPKTEGGTRFAGFVDREGNPLGLQELRGPRSS